jgi:LPXTG-site transpeptidase (sortase) family protein
MMNINRRTGKYLRSAALLLALLAILLAIYLVVYYMESNNREEKLFQKHLDDTGISITPVSEKERNEYQVAPDRPRYIHIPAIGVSKARVLALGLKEVGRDGQQQLDVPKNINDVGWYDCGSSLVADQRCAQPALPGAGHTEMAAVLTGHTCFSRSMTCVFDNISKLKYGDTITIERGDGELINYLVKQVETVKLADVDMAKAMRPIEPGREGLTLITCAGTYQGAVDANGKPTADKRVLVYAVRGDATE